MIGRGSLGNPWIFRRTVEFLRSGRILPMPTPDEKIEMLKRHIDMLIELKGEHTAVCEMRKHAAWYIKGMKNAAAARDRIFRATSREELIGILEEYKNRVSDDF